MKVKKYFYRRSKPWELRGFWYGLAVILGWEFGKWSMGWFIDLVEKL